MGGLASSPLLLKPALREPAPCERDLPFRPALRDPMSAPRFVFSRPDKSEEMGWASPSEACSATLVTVGAVTEALLMRSNMPNRPGVGAAKAVAARRREKVAKRFMIADWICRECSGRLDGTMEWYEE